MSGVQARQTIEDSVRRELFGPVNEAAPQGQALDCSSGVVQFSDREASQGQFHDARTGEEVLTRSDPLRRYGVGVLFPQGATPFGSVPDSTTDDDVGVVAGLPSGDETIESPDITVPQAPRHDEADSDDFDLADANRYRPSAMAISFNCTCPPGGMLRITISGAYYDRIKAEIPGYRQPFEWWVRRPFDLEGVVHDVALRSDVRQVTLIDVEPIGPAPRIGPAARLFSRPDPGGTDQTLVTVAVVNQSGGTGPGQSLFQMGFQVHTVGGAKIEPYPDGSNSADDEEEESNRLLFRHKRTFAIGHGCAADWDSSSDERVEWVAATAMPSYEIPNLTPDIFRREADGSRIPVRISMSDLASGSESGRVEIEELLDLYEVWIDDRRNEVAGLPTQHRNAANRHIQHCSQALERMREGWALCQSDPLAARAFQLTNQAMLAQQVRSRLPLRKVERGSDDTLRVSGPHPPATPQPGQGFWRPFQIAFLLAVVPELVRPHHQRRSLVDLIFFPTGGGKTEAYLAASAFSLLTRRLRDPSDAGTDTLMRYTLRLLTAQQFVRAASLVCVLEDMRSQLEDELGEPRISIGIWLGGESTPNNWQQATAALASLRRDSREQNKFLLLRCPWCGAQMGTVQRDRNRQDVVGYEQVGSKVVLRCIDRHCRFARREGLPVYVVDQGIYEERPSIIIGTVDKFAMLPWLPQAHTLFGLGETGERTASPPGLIIQDELHLISGPLGSMVGLYEPVIEALCTDNRGEVPTPPKIIASTATIRRYADQVLALYGRTDVALFPPLGLDDGRSFFAEPETEPDGTLSPGRRYVGIFSASLGSTQTVQVRVAAATLQGATEIPEEYRDGYWTNLNFLNSLRELGNTVSLLESDVPDYLTGLKYRDSINPRWPRNTMELTSRRRSDEIPEAIEKLQLAYGSQGCVDICLASNIIEVGVDIDRLALLTIVGQPKTTAQYIQVSGRVGRRPQVSPGLVLTIYGAAKPRDRSHYERFRSYHQSLYGQVEPTSVTPFARPVLRRALHAAVIAEMRTNDPDLSPYPFPIAEFDQAARLLRQRAELVDRDELDQFDHMLEERRRQWDRWERTEWSANAINGSPTQGLMRFAGTLPDLDSRSSIWDVPTSMRNVDAECRLQISLAYNQEDARNGHGP